LIYTIVVGLIAGWAAGKIMKGSGYGVLMDILLGIAGGLVGGLVLRLFGFYTTGGLLPHYSCGHSWGCIAGCDRTQAEERLTSQNRPV
jgi:uncharacterized membrane protein YeaQ/YmgE (transglycosylase-associated protein family)